MTLHRLASVTIGVPNVDETARYYTDFGLTPVGGHRFATTDGGEQLRLVATPTRGSCPDGRRGRPRRPRPRHGRTDPPRRPERAAGEPVVTQEPVTGVTVVVAVGPRVSQPTVAATAVQRAGSDRTRGRPGARGAAHAAGAAAQARPRRARHAPTSRPPSGSSSTASASRLCDRVAGAGAFLRCSTDHHNVLVHAGARCSFLHHTSWQVDDVDEVGRGAAAMLAGHPDRHVWGLGRHHAGSNFFWYLKDPAGNFAEYYSDMDCVIDDQLWTPETLEGAKGLFSWGPPPPPSFLAPDDLAELMVGAHLPG